jgi:hypothetical protein
VEIPANRWIRDCVTTRIRKNEPISLPLAA